jgi:hypothetical protein
MIMDLIQFIKEYRSFRQKIGEELGVKEDELVLKFFMAFKRLHRANNSAFLNNLFDAMNPYINKSSNLNLQIPIPMITMMTLSVIQVITITHLDKYKYSFRE